MFEELGYTKEEWKMVYETRKILDEPGLAVSPTTVRVPVWRSHSESINIETEKPLTVEEARRILSEAEGVEVIDDPQAMAYPMPITATGKDPVYVGRIRRDPSIENGLEPWGGGRPDPQRRRPQCLADRRGRVRQRLALRAIAFIKARQGRASDDTVAGRGERWTASSSRSLAAPPWRRRS